MKVLTISQPNEKQKIALLANTKHIGYGGARGGGKSWFVRTKAKLLALKYPGIKILIVRRTYKELLNNHINFLIPELNGIAKYNRSDKVFTFKNRSTINFGYCNNDADLLQYQGAEYDVIFLDEATQLSEFQMKNIVACLRGVNGFPKRIYYTCNPGGQGHQYIKRIFIDKVYEEGENPEDYTFIQALVTDNKVLMETQPDYIKQLEALPPKLREAWMNGRWDVFEGAYFEEFRATPDPQKCYEAGISKEEALHERRWTHVIKPFDIPKDWKIYRSYDWGYGKPFSVGWWAVDYDDTAYRILELYGCTGTPNEGVHWSNKEQMDKIAEIEREHPWLKGKQILGVADPSIWDGSKGISAAEEADNHGIWFEKGINDRIAGWMQVRERLRFDENGFAKMYFFENCKAIIRCMPLMMYDDHKPEDLNTDLEDHSLDDCRYFCMMRPIAPRMIEVNKPVLFDPLNQFEIKNNAYNRAVIRRT